MRAFCLIALSLMSLPIRAETWECKAPIEQIPWSATELIAVSGEKDNASVQIGGKLYSAEYELDGTTNIWLISPEPADDFNGGVLEIHANGDGIMRREFRYPNGTVAHTEETYLCRKTDFATE